MKVQKAIEISDAKIQFISLVDKAANRRQFLITKAKDGKAKFSTFGKILKVDNATHYITGIVYEPMTEDAHGNFMTEEEIRKAAYWFAKNGDKVDIQHSFEAAGGVTVVENFIAPCDMKIEGQPVTKGAWLLTVEVTDAGIWDAVQKGEITGFSMGGLGKYKEEDIELKDVSKETSAGSAATEKKSLFKRLAEAFGFDVVEKDTFNNESSEKEEIGMDKNKQEIQDMIDESIKRALAPLEKETSQGPQGESSENSEPPKESKGDLSKEEIQTMIDESIKRALASLQNPAEPKEGVMKWADPIPDMQEMISKSVNDAIEPMVKALNARGVPSNLNGGGEQVTKADQHYLHGIL